MERERDVADKMAAESGRAVRPLDESASIRGCTVGWQPRGIGWAVAQMYHGLKLRRAGWNGRGMYVALQVPGLHSANTLPYVWIHTVQGDRVPWLCSQTDLLAHDWEVATVDDL